MKKFFLFILFLLLFLISIISFNTLRFSSVQGELKKEGRKFEKDSVAIRHLSESIRIKTISYDNNSQTDYSQFDSLFIFFRKSFPLTFSKLNVRVINQHSLLIEWKGKSTALKPVILYSHLDVVPAGKDSNSQWTHDPFAGLADDHFIYGRGAIDDKGSVIAILESVEKLLTTDFTPARTVYLAFGHDEEASGEKGAKKIAETLARENIKADFLLDEGGLVAIDMVPFVSRPVALVFTSEKGYMTIELKVKSNGGHSGFPPVDPPIEILAQAIKNIHDHPFEKRMTESVSEFMDFVGPEMKMPFKLLFANRWIFSPLIFHEYEKIPSANAMIRTTSVATVIQGGEKENVVPTEVKAKINFRILPGDSSASVLRQIEEIINDKRVEVKVIGFPSEPSTISSANTPGFQTLRKTISNIFPDAIIAPSLLIAQTDSRHFRNVTENIYRFQPVRMDDKILKTMHGTDEKISIDGFMEMISFYEDFVRNL